MKTNHRHQDHPDRETMVLLSSNQKYRIGNAPCSTRLRTLECQYIEICRTRLFSANIPPKKALKLALLFLAVPRQLYYHQETEILHHLALSLLKEFC